MGFPFSLSLNEEQVLRSLGVGGPVRLLDVHERSGLDQYDFAETVNQLLRAGVIESSPPRENVHLSEMPHTFVDVNRAHALRLRQMLAGGGIS
jgi:DNA-binding MarR family transcriptional regulator